MMELPFSIVAFLRFINEKPIFLVMFSAFHPLLLFLMFIPLGILKRLNIYNFQQDKSMFIYFIMLVLMTGWVLGFVSQILLLFMDVPGIKMLLIYICMYICILFFYLFNAKPTRKYIDNF